MTSSAQTSQAAPTGAELAAAVETLRAAGINVSATQPAKPALKPHRQSRLRTFGEFLGLVFLTIVGIPAAMFLIIAIAIALK